ncbi:hypothetical protein NEOLEDRAFT_1244908 [Neolentinus lepideus HHB14362 ss-1]|uniref:Uncharacterized protein n=1 Tax=Neolentinus lepideus HHB14362 ss-1 TaxID=1314782 RepID=A0A165PF20_9AGAM|nr:hypothetical protein NEOLEDRAFT_1244908 [Neolentinus lepideus HHB14362 ss-1]
MDFWRNSDYVTLRAVDSSTAWPEETKSLTEQLKEPLPSWIYNGPHPFVSDHCMSLAAELQEQRSALLIDLVDTPFKGSCLDDALRQCFDMGLRATALLRSVMLSECEMTQEPIPKISTFANLVRDLMLLQTPNLLPLEQVEYVLPRHPEFAHNPLFKFTRKTAIAPLILCHRPSKSCNGSALHFPSTPPDSTGSLSPRDLCSASADDPRGLQCSSSPSRDVSLSAGTPESLLHPAEKSVPRRWEAWELAALDHACTEPESEPESEESDDDSSPGELEPSLNKHLLASASSSDRPVFPILCMAVREEIFGLIASSLYQRYAWRIKDPVVGLTYRHGSPMMQVVVGWLDDAEMSDGELPHVNIAFGNSVKYPVSLGIFNLCDPIGTLRLIAFLSSLRKHMEHFCSCTSDALVTDSVIPVIWRSDFDLEEENDNESEDLDSGIAKWADEVAVAISDSPGSGTVIRRTAMTENKPKTRSSTRSSTQSSSAASHSSQQNTKRLLTVPEDGGLIVPTPTQSPKAPKKNTAISLKSGRVSCSALARGSAQTWGEDKEDHLLQWMADRMAMLAAFFNEPDHEALKLYEKYTAFRWPEEWKTLEGMPIVDPLVENLKEELYLSYRAREEHVADGSASPADFIPSNSPIHTMVQSRLSVILYACQGARSRQESNEEHNIYEADTRRAWDVLLAGLFQSEDTFALPERIINLPKNINKEHGYSDTFHSTFDAYISQQNESNVTRLNRERRSMSKELYDYIFRYTRKVSNFMEKWWFGKDTFTTDSKERGDKESLDGKCDQVCTVRLRDFYPLGVSELRKDHRFILQADRSTQTDPSPPPLTASPSQQQKPESRKPDNRSNQTNVKMSPANLFGGPRNEARFAHPKDPGSELSQSFQRLKISSSNAAGTGALQTKQEGAAKEFRSLYAPVLLTEYKKASEADAHVGINQARLYTVAGSKFLAHLGVYDFPVFGLVTDGARGAVSCTYTSPPEKKEGARSTKAPLLETTRVTEGNARIFDISTPLGAFHFSTFLCMLVKEHAPLLEERLNRVRKEFQSRCLAKDPSLLWSMTLQLAPPEDFGV